MKCFFLFLSVFLFSCSFNKTKKNAKPVPKAVINKSNGDRVNENNLYSIPDGLSEDARNGIKRNIVYLIFTGKINETSKSSIIKGMKEVKAISKKTLFFKESAYLNKLAVKWQKECMIKRDIGFGKQVNYPKMLARLNYTMRYYPSSYAILIVDSDLTSYPEDYNNFVYGVSSYPRIIISTRRQEKNDLKHVVMHEFFHSLGLVGRKFDNDSGNEYRNNHCAYKGRVCLMNQVDVEGCLSGSEHSRLLSLERDILCPSCQQELEYICKYFKNLKGYNFW
ncbi:MAG: hypothetical protein JXA60_09620 [Candidatus Coatesbacteria bacterium]|nr:hypothetical protein [Candidatus Coatesbacteria bacterium]